MPFYTGITVIAMCLPKGVIGSPNRLNDDPELQHLSVGMCLSLAGLAVTQQRLTLALEWGIALVILSHFA